MYGILENTHAEREGMNEAARVSRHSKNHKAPHNHRKSEDGNSYSADKVLKSFNTWSFKRQQPDTPERLARAVEHALADGRPVEFVMYWGRGPRRHAAEPEAQCLDYLGSLIHRVELAYPIGAALHLVFTDTHARINGYDDVSTARYFLEVAKLAGAKGFSTVAMSEVMGEAGPIREIPEDEHLPGSALLAKLSASAAKWHRGRATPVEAARFYFRANLRERQAIERVYPLAIFITFNGGDLRPLFPENLPIFYMYSLRRGTSEKPWFIDAPVLKDSATLAAE